MGYFDSNTIRVGGLDYRGNFFVHRRTAQLLLIPAASLACLVLAGCGGSADADTPPPTVTVTATQTTVRTVTTTATPPTVTSTVTPAPVTSTVTTTAAAPVDAGAGAGAGAEVPAPAADPAPQALVAPPSSQPSTQPQSQSAYYKNCSAAKAAGAAPLYAGQPGYRSGLDGDNDGVACEK